MAKSSIRLYSTTAASNTDVGGVGIQGTDPASNMDDGLREVMSHLAETNAGTAPVDDTWSFCDPADATKKVRVDAGNVTAGQTRVLTMPDADVTIPSGTIVTETATQTITNKNISDATNTYRSASTTAAGAVELATDAEAQTGTDTARAITPANLQAVTATETRKGVVELATTTEAATGTDTARAVTPAGLAARFVLGTAQATTSGTAFDYGSIPSWVKRITVLFSAVGLSGTDHILVQIGDSGGVAATGYSSTGAIVYGSQSNDEDTSTAGFIIRMRTAADQFTGKMTLEKVDGNTWVASYAGQIGTGATAGHGGGGKTLSNTADRLRITRSGTNTFGAGSVNIMYE